jgi:energy-coupling factor transport system substrate-specific component
MNLFAQNKKEPKKERNSQLNQVREMCIFAMLGTLMFCSKIIMEVLPNIHLLGMLTMVYTIVYRKKALIPIYIYVLLNGLFAGFSVWWIPYLYLWTVLWAVTMLLPRKMSKKAACIVYPIVCSLHGFAFGILYAPAQALFFGLDFEKTVAWILSGAPFDVVHGIGNLIAGLLVVPLSEMLKKLTRKPV